MESRLKDVAHCLGLRDGNYCWKKCDLTHNSWFKRSWHQNCQISKTWQFVISCVYPQGIVKNKIKETNQLTKLHLRNFGPLHLVFVWMGTRVAGPWVGAEDIGFYSMSGLAEMRKSRWGMNWSHLKNISEAHWFLGRWQSRKDHRKSKAILQIENGKNHIIPDIGVQDKNRDRNEAHHQIHTQYLVNIVKFGAGRF